MPSSQGRVCVRCGEPIPPSRRKYCPVCAVLVRRERKREYQRRYRRLLRGLGREGLGEGRLGPHRNPDPRVEAGAVRRELRRLLGRSSSGFRDSQVSPGPLTLPPPVRGSCPECFSDQVFWDPLLREFSCRECGLVLSGSYEYSAGFRVDFPWGLVI